MAGPTVTLTFAGDSAKLTDTTTKVGSAVEDMGRKVGSASEQMTKTGSSVNDLADKAGTGERRFIGFKDSITGTQDVITGFREGDMLGMAQGFADLAGGMEGFLIPMIGQAATGLKVGLGGAMTFIAAHPLLLVLGLLIAAFVALWLSSEDFRRVVIGAFNAVSGFIQDEFGGTLGWVRDRFTELVNWFGDVPGKIGRSLAGIGEAVGGAFKFALNMAIGYLNFWIDRANNLIHGINVINPFDDIPSIPHIAKLHQGGTVPGAPGTEVLTLLQAGETVTAAGESPRGGRVELGVADGATGAVAELINYLINEQLLVAVAR